MSLMQNGSRFALPVLALCVACGDPAPAPPAAAPVDCNTVDTTTPAPGPFASCAEIPGLECFANSDCPSQQRCQSVGAAGSYVVCCIDGARGSCPLGAACDFASGELTCTSGLCMEDTAGTYCSDSCQSDADCPAVLPHCAPIAFSGSAASWCQPF